MRNGAVPLALKPLLLCCCCCCCCCCLAVGVRPPPAQRAVVVAGGMGENRTTTITEAIGRLSDATVRSLLIQASLHERTTGDAVLTAAGIGDIAAAAPTVTHLSRRRVALDGDQSSTLVGRQIVVTGSGFVSIGRPLCNVSCASRLEGFTAGFLPPRQASATVLNSTHLTCVLPPVDTAGPAHVRVSMNNGVTWSAETEASQVEYFPLVSLAVGRRPYTTETEGKLLVALSPELVGASSRVTASAALSGTNPRTVLVKSERLYSEHNVLSFAFPKQRNIEKDVVLSVNIVPGLEINKTRRLVRHVPTSGQRNIVVVDHHTRSLRVDGTAWQGTGWYIFSGFNCNGSSIAPPWDWPASGPGSFLDQVNQLSAAGFNQFVVYDLDRIVCGRDPAKTLVPILDEIAAVGAKVMLDLRAEVEVVMKNNRTSDWEYFHGIVDAVRSHAAILSYYVCDDCCKFPLDSSGVGELYTEQLANVAAALRSVDPFHPISGAIQCPRANVFMDGPGGTYALDIVIYENYDQLLTGHMGSGLFKNIDPQGDAPLRRYPGMLPRIPTTQYDTTDYVAEFAGSYPVEYEPLVNGLSGQGTQFISVAATASHPEFDTMPNSPEAMRAIAWLGTVHGLNNIFWFDFLAQFDFLGPDGRLSQRVSQAAWEMRELHPSLTTNLDGSVPRATVIAVARDVAHQPLIRAQAWAEHSATVGLCVHALIVNAAAQSAEVSVRIDLLDANGTSVQPHPLAGWKNATLPFGAFDSGEIVPVFDGVLADSVPSFGLRLYRLGCEMSPSPAAGLHSDYGTYGDESQNNLLRNPSFEEVTVTGGVAWWGLFWQYDWRDRRVAMVSDTQHALDGRHSMRLIVPSAKPGWGGRAVPVPLSLGASGGPGSGWQGLAIKAGKKYNVSIWARADPAGNDLMNLSIATGHWTGSAIAKGWEYYTCAGDLRNASAYPDGACAPGTGGLITATLTTNWRQLTAVRAKPTTDKRPESFQLLASGQGSIYIDRAYVGIIDE